MKKVVKLSQPLADTFSVIKDFIKRNKQAPLVSEVAFDLALSWSAANERVNKLIKAKKVAKNKKGELSVK